ncbi:MAG: hypothetical protein ABSA26_05720 [Thermoguttaceae bacterium]
MAKLSSILVLLVMNLMVVGTTSAAIQLGLHNNNLTTPTILEGYPDNSQFGSITKDGVGTDIIQISLTNTGNTNINAGLVRFDGLVTNLSNVTGSNLGVGDGFRSSNLTANSIDADTLTITAGSVITIRAINYKEPPVTTPEPVSWVIWLLIGSIAVLAYRHRR